MDETINQFREQHAEFRAVERAADLGDLVIVDYTLAPEGMDPRREEPMASPRPGPGDAGDGGSGHRPLPPGGTRTTRLKFADDHRTEALRGKGGEATVTVKEVKEKVLPVLDDEFAKSMGPFGDAWTRWKAELRWTSRPGATGRTRRALEDAVVETLLGAHDFQVPDALVLRQVGHQIERHPRAAPPPGRGPGQAAPGTTPSSSRSSSPARRRRSKRALLLEAIAEKEGLAPAEEQVDAEVERIAQASQQPGSCSAPHDGAERGSRQPAHTLRESRTLDHLIERAKIAP